MSKTINISVANKNAVNVSGDVLYICGNSDFIINFAFDDEWNEFDTKTARFVYNSTFQDVVFKGNQCPVPIISNAYIIKVGVFAGNLRTTTPAIVSAKKSILCGKGSPAAPSEDVYHQIMELIQGNGGSSVEPAEDDIPKVFFGGALQQTKDEAVVPFRYISQTEDISGYAEIKAQGNSSMSYPKKNQTVKLFDDAECTKKLKVDFKGWGKQNKHVYKANWIDITHARNVVSARLWADVVKSRANYAELPELLRTSPNQGAVDGFPVKVYADGVYQGRYTLNIPKDAWMANMDDDLDNHCILCGENYVSGCFRAAANINGSDWTDEVHDTVPASIKTRWNEVISFVMNSGDEEFRANLNQYFYVDSLIDYYLFGLASCGLDAFGKNQLYMTYDGRKWFAAMYDMDSTWGLWWNGSRFVATDYDRSEYQDFKDGEGNLLYIRMEALFHEELQARWAELRSDALSIENIINRFERFTDITPAELVEEDYASTTADGKFTGIPSKTTSTIQQIRGYAVARHAWCDTYIAALTDGGEVEPDVPDVPATIPCTGVTLSANTLTFTTKGTQTLTATVTPVGCTDELVWVSDNPTVAAITVDGAVCTVTAVANGDCTISVTCGEYSASCGVSVVGVDVRPIYSFKNGTSNYTQDASIEVSNGNHIKISFGSSWFDYHFYAVLDDVTHMDGVSASDKESIFTAYQNSLTEAVYGTLPVGGTITRRIKNLTITGLGSEVGPTVAQNVWIGTDKIERKFNTDFKLSTDVSDIEGSYTNNTSGDEAIWGFPLWISAKTAAGLEIEFDIEIYVGDVRYI